MFDSKPCESPISAGTKCSLHIGEPFSEPTVYRSTIGTLHKGLWFKRASRLSLETYYNADRTSSFDDRKSTSGNCVFLCGNLILWSSRKQTIVARSSAEAEYRSIANLPSEIT
ncbi:hypothetical protein ACOSQ3_021300 [Xanthoceras sorbifolium]